MKVDRKLLPIKSHYFLQYAGSSFLTMVLPLIIRQKGVSSQGIGIIFTVIPIVGLFVNSISGTLADYYKAYRLFFLFSIVSLSSGLISMYCLPSIPNLEMQQFKDLEVTTHSLVSTESSISPLDTSNSQHLVISKINNMDANQNNRRYPDMMTFIGSISPKIPGTLVNNSSSKDSTISSINHTMKESTSNVPNTNTVLDTRKSRMIRKRDTFGETTGSHLFAMTSSLGHDVMGSREFSVLKIDPVLAMEEGQILLPTPILIQDVDSQDSQTMEDKEILKKVNEDQEKKYQVENQCNYQPLDFSELAKFSQFWLIFICAMAAHIGLNLCIMISDTVCFLLLGHEGHKYGQQRLWGTLGMGVMAIVVGAIVDEYSTSLSSPDYFPAIIICAVLMSIDFGVVARMHIPYAKNLKAKLGDVKGVLLRPQVVLFLIAVYIISTSMGILWVFKMMMIEDVALEWDPNFSSLKLLQGLDLGIETFGGEMPLFFLSGKIIQRLGYTSVLMISIASMGVRCCLYYFVRNPWWFLPVELLNGLSYGLFHAVMASYASYVAPLGTQATLQAITRAGFSIGLSTAGYIGGQLYFSLGRGGLMYLVVGLFNIVFGLIYALLSIIFEKQCDNYSNTGRIGYASSRSSVPSSDDEEDKEEDISAEQLMMQRV